MAVIVVGGDDTVLVVCFEYNVTGAFDRTEETKQISVQNINVAYRPETIIKRPFAFASSLKPQASRRRIQMPHSSGFRPAEDGGMVIFHQPLKCRFFHGFARNS